MNRIEMFLNVLIGGLLVSSALCAPVNEQKQKQKVKKRDIGSMSRAGENMALDSYRGEVLPGMVDDQVAEAFLRDAAREDERQERRKEEEEEEEEEEAAEDEGPIEVPLALPMARLTDEDVMEYAQEKPAPHRSKALSEDIYPAEDEGYLPYYSTGEVYFRRRRRARPISPRIVRKRSPYRSTRDVVRPRKLRSERRKRQIRLSDDDLNALITFLTNLKVTMERASGECNNLAHHSFFREKDLNEELGAGSGIDEDYSDEEQQTSPEQEYPVWLMPRPHQIEPLMAVPQRRTFYYPTLLPGQKRSAGRFSGAQRRLENKLLGLRRVADSESPSRRFFQ